MKNHQSYSIGTEPFPEVNVISSQTNGHGRSRSRGSGRGCGSLDTMELMVIILPIKGKLQCTTRSGIIPRQNKMRSMHRIRLPKAMRIHAIDVI